MASVTIQGKCFIPFSLEFGNFLKQLLTKIAHVKGSLPFRPLLQSKEHNYLTREELQFEQQCSVWGEFWYCS